MTTAPTAISEIDDPDQIRPVLWQSGRFVHMPLRGYDPTYRFKPGSSASGNVTRLRAIADAIAEAGGGVLEFDPVSFNLDSATLGTTGIELPGNLLIRGNGAVLNVTGSTACNVFLANNVSDITLEGLEAHGNGVTSGFGNGEFIRFTNSTASSIMRNLHVRDLNLYNFAGQYWIAFIANAVGARVSNFSVRSIVGTSEPETEVYAPTSVGSHAYVIGINAVSGFCERFVVDDVVSDATYIKGTVLAIAAGTISSVITIVQDGKISNIRGQGAGKNIATDNNGSYDVCFYGAVRDVELDGFVSRDAWDKGLYVAATLDCSFRNVNVSGQTGTYAGLLDAGVSLNATRATLENIECRGNTINLIHNCSNKYWVDISPCMHGEYMARVDTTLPVWGQSAVYSVGNRITNVGVAASPWTPNTDFTAGQSVTNGGRTYTCSVSGTSASSGGPTGYNWGYAQADGTTSWIYVVPVTLECTIAGTSAASGVGPRSVSSSNLTDGTVHWKAVPPNVYQAFVSNADRVGLTGATGPLSATTGLTDGDVTWVYVGTEIPVGTKINNLICEDATIGPSVKLQATGAGTGVEVRNFFISTRVGKSLVAQATAAQYTNLKMSDGVIEGYSSAAYAVDWDENAVSSPCAIDWDNVVVNYDGPSTGVRLRDMYGDVNLNNVKINKALTSTASGSLLEILGSDPTTGGFYATPSLTNIQLNGVRSGVIGINGQANCHPRQMQGINFRTAAGTLASANSPGLAAPTWSGQKGQRIQNLLVGSGLAADWICTGGTTWLDSGTLP